LRRVPVATYRFGKLYPANESSDPSIRERITAASSQYLKKKTMSDTAALNELSWSWIALALAAPSLVALLVAVPFWRGGQTTFGSIVGTAVIFASAMALIMREYAILDRLTLECLDAGTVCWPQPSAFTRFAIYAFIGLVEVFALFTLGLVVEERIRRRSYSREWR
jgi:hypothetical protein